jgi:hypothetical protein
MASTFFRPGEHWKLSWAFAGSGTNGRKPESPVLLTGEEYFARQEMK